MAAPILDGDIPTLHIRCGSDIRDKLRVAGFVGEFLEYSDPLCQGPVRDVPDFLQQRARFLAAAYGADDAETRLREADHRLNAACHAARVVLWFEHDSYDQLILARCLARFAHGPRPAKLELICIDRHPDIPRFIGLGQLEAPALAALWPVREMVTQQQFDLGQAVWTALRLPDPADLAAIAATGTPALPIMAPALRRHLKELPGLLDGLSLTQRLVLQILSEAPSAIGRIFGAFQAGREPLPFLGDLMLLHVIEQMALTPVLTIAEGDKPFSRIASITEIGRQVLAGQTNYLSLRPPERWVGGVAVSF